MLVKKARFLVKKAQKRSSFLRGTERVIPSPRRLTAVFSAGLHAHLSCTQRRHARHIVVTNSFDGKTRKKDRQYQSTKHAGEAQGLASVTSTVELYGGMAKFSHEGNRFFSNVAIPL